MEHGLMMVTKNREALDFVVSVVYFPYREIWLG